MCDAAPKYIPLPQEGTFITFEIDGEGTLKRWDTPQHSLNYSHYRGRFAGFIEEVHGLPESHLLLRVRLLTVGSPGFGRKKLIPVQPTPTTSGRSAMVVSQALPWGRCYLLSKHCVALHAHETAAPESARFKVTSRETNRCANIFWDDLQSRSPTAWFRRLLRQRVPLEDDLYTVWENDGLTPAIKNVSNQPLLDPPPDSPDALLRARKTLVRLHKNARATAIRRAQKLDKDAYGSRLV